MDYGRNSQYRGQSHNNRTGQKQRKEPKEEDWILPRDEIAGCIQDLAPAIGFTIIDLQTPQPQKIQKVFECFAELLLNTTIETVEPAMRAAAYEICGPDLTGIMPDDTRNQMGFFVMMRNLMVDVGFSDFRFTDLTKPEPRRILHIFSSLINFVRFRQQYNEAIEKQFDKLEGTKQRVQDLQVSNQNLEVRLAELKSQRRSMADEYERATAHNDKLSTKLRRLQKEQDERGIEHDRVKSKKTSLMAAYQEKEARKLTLMKENEKLRPYALSSAQDLQDQLNELRQGLRRDKEALAGAEKRYRALHTSSDTFKTAASGVESVLALLKSLQEDMKNADAEIAAANKREDSLRERSRDVKKSDQEKALLLSQLETWTNRLEKLRKDAEVTNRAASQRIQDLAAQRKQIMAEQGEKGREVERRKIRVEQAEKRMADLRDSIEAEIHATKQEYLKMDKHIRLYIAEMDKCIDTQW